MTWEAIYYLNDMIKCALAKLDRYLIFKYHGYRQYRCKATPLIWDSQ